MTPASRHPSWCEHQLAPSDETHAHTAVVGVTYLARDATVEVVLAQSPGARRPTLALNVSAPTAKVGIDVTVAQAWAIAGTLIDATTAYAQALPYVSASPSTDVPAASALPGGGRVRPVWLVDRHPNGRMPGRRSGQRSFRCGRAGEPR